MIDLPAETAVVLHDAGAANHVISWIDAGLVPASRVCAMGPAATLWHDRPRPALLQSVECALEGAEALVSGSGWQSDVEHQARAIARQRNIPSYAMLDHWVNYADRFIRNAIRVLPDCMLVADSEAEALARKTFAGLPVYHMPNIYMKQQLDAIKAAESGTKPRHLLVVLEPARSNWERNVPGEFQALDYLLARRDDAGISRALPLQLRPHPSEPEGKYAQWMLKNAAATPTLSTSPTLAASIAESAVVTGMNSYALTIALAAGRTVWSMLPPWAPPCILPHGGIRHLKSLPAKAS